MAFKDLADFQDADLHLPYKGKTYTVTAPDLDLGLYLQQVFALGVKVHAGGTPTEQDAARMNDGQEQDFTQRCLGELYEELRADRVPFKVISLMAQTLLLDTCVDRETAETFWASGGKAQAPRKAPQDYQQKTATQTRTGEESTTRQPDSANGTSTPKDAAPAATA